MKLRWKYGSALAAAAVAFGCWAPDASARQGFQAASTNTYSAQTVALAGGSVAIPSLPALGAPNSGLNYASTSGQFAGAVAGAAGDVITFTALTSGATFTGTPVAQCNPACPAATTLTVAVTGNTITVTVSSTVNFPPALAVPVGTEISLVSSIAAPPAGSFLGPAVTLNGVSNLQTAPPTTATAGVGAAPTVVLGTPNAAAAPPNGPFFQNAFGVTQIPNIIQVQASCTASGVICGAIPTNDPNPLVAMQLASANSFTLATAPNTQLVDLTGVNSSIPGTQFQTVTGGQASATTAGFLGQFSLQSQATLLDARFGNACCNNSGNTVGGNTPLAGTADVKITGDFQTILAAYLRQGNLITQGQQAVEQTPSANGTCTPSTASGDIISSPLPLATGQTAIEFSVPSTTNTSVTAGGTSPATFVNVPVYAICVVTNATNIIPSTFNSPSTAPAQGVGGGPAVGAGTNWTVTVSGTGFANLVLARNTHPGFDIAYAGSVVTFNQVFPASSGFPTFIRLVNTGVGTFPMFALLQKDGGSPLNIPGSFAAMTPFAAFYVSADSIAAQGGTTLAAHNTLTILTPSTTVIATKLVGEPTGDIVLTGNGL